MKKFILSILFTGILFVNPMDAKTSFENNTQETRVEQRVISFNDKFYYQLDENTSWSISNTKNNSSLQSGMGSITDFVFPETGTFTIEIFEVITQTDCSHTHFPNKIVVEVSPLKLAFDFSTIKFNNEIIGGQSQDNNTITVDVYFSNTKNESIEFTNGQLASAGVGVTIEGKLVDEKTILTPGLNHLTYKLAGTATSQTYVMFNFIDINNQVVSYYLPTKIK
jgi:hypothetical protein